MTTFSGKLGIVKVGANVVAEIDDWSFDEQASTDEDTAQGDTAQTFKPGLTTWTGQINCHWDDTDTLGQEALAINQEVAVKFYPEGSALGLQEYAGNAIVTGISIGSGKTGIASRSITLQGSGVMTVGPQA